MASYLEKIMNIAMDDNIEIAEMFNEKETQRIVNNDNVYVAYATDKMFSGWGMSQGRLNHVFVICFSEAQAVYSSLANQKCMQRANYRPLENFINSRHGGTWSVKNANECAAWNKEIIVP